jgi:hypothetical protein
VSAKKKAPRKTTGATTAIAKIPQPHGGALNAGGTPGNKGGRPPDEHIQWARGLVSDPTCEQQVEAVIKDSKHPAWAATVKALWERAYGKAPATITHQVKATDPEVRARVRWMFDVVRSNETWERRALLEALMPVWSTTSTVPAHYLTAESK